MNMITSNFYFFTDEIRNIFISKKNGGISEMCEERVLGILTEKLSQKIILNFSIYLKYYLTYKNFYFSSNKKTID